MKWSFITEVSLVVEAFTALKSVGQRFSSLFTFDYRSMALFRVLIAAVVIGK